MADSAIQQTDNDALLSKCSCVEAGYYADEFLHIFTSSGKIRRNPIINMGHYIRVSLMRRLISEFVQTVSSECQIVILGAGSDTNGLWALKEFGDVLTVFEIDFSGTIHKKYRNLVNHSKKAQFLFRGGGKPAFQVDPDGEMQWMCDKLKLLGHDLRSSLDKLEMKLENAGFKKGIPTLFMAECVLIYMTRAESDRVLSWISKQVFESVGIVGVYEPINGTDRFGQKMVENLLERGTPLMSLMSTVAEQKDRYRDLGFKQVRVEKMSHFSRLLEIKKVEIIDELEELNLFQDHYSFTLAATNDLANDIMSRVFDRNDNL